MYYTRVIEMFAKPKSIKDFPKVKRPRERLATVGLDNLTQEELLAIILGFGTKKQNVLSLSKTILKKFSLQKLKDISIKQLCKIDGVGEIQAGKILAAIELGKRAIEKDHGGKLVFSPQDAIQEVVEIRTKQQEYLVVLYLNARYHLIQKQIVAIGSLNQSIVEPRDILANAIVLPSAFIILVHNHPSNETTPSKEDLNFTKQIKQASKLIGINLVDHLIVSQDNYFSFKENGLI